MEMRFIGVSSASIRHGRRFAFHEAHPGKIVRAADGWQSAHLTVR
jgi:hypothetical protein